MSATEEPVFARSRWVRPPAGTRQEHPGRLAAGFGAAARACGLKGRGRTDVAVVAATGSSSTSALLLTRNAAAAAPVRLCRHEVDRGAVRALAVNAGNANAATGERGLVDARRMQAAAAEQLGLDPSSVAVAETGVIGVPLPIDDVERGVREAAASLSPTAGVALSEAIMTTDAWPKRITLTLDGVTLSAQAKGAGMIEPGFATTLCFVQTDAELTPAEAERALRVAAGDSFERITVDGQMSTNDTMLLQASGESGRPLPEGLLESALLHLALEVVADGEGASRVGRVEVTGAASAQEAERAARAIANSPLVKTALYGRDPNWGRIAQASGMALAGEELAELGADEIRSEEIAGEAREVELGVELGRGTEAAHVYFSDLTHRYVEINAEYTT